MRKISIILAAATVAFLLSSCQLNPPEEKHAPGKMETTETLAKHSI
jgi:PBP1b-binding outer membrane lipoprotein LpoB